MKHITIGQMNLLNSSDHGELAHRYELAAQALDWVGPLDVLMVQELSEPDILRQFMEPIGFTHMVMGDILPSRSAPSGVAILSRTPLELVPVPEHQRIIGATTEFEGVPLNLFSGHLAWGPRGEAERLRQATDIENHANALEEARPGSLSILGADANALPESRTMRYFRGLDLGADGESSTLWMDAWEECGTEENWATTDQGKNHWGQRTARSVGIQHPEMMPARRIDYLLSRGTSRGWNYGHRGQVKAFRHIYHPQGLEYSDHQGIWAAFML